MSARVFDHVLVIMFENQYRGYVKENAYFARLARAGVELENAFGVMHPSQTNYIASIAGELCNVTSDEQPGRLPQRTVVDLLETAGLGWKAYMDGYSPALQPWTEGLVPGDDYPYVVKHNPFSSFAGIVNSRARWERIVGDPQLWTDVQNRALPEYGWLTPDMWNDGHYVRGTTRAPEARAPELVDQAAEWLQWFFSTLRFPGPRSLLPPQTLVVVTFDEADFEAAWDARDKYTYDGPNQVYTVLLGDVVQPGTVEREGYNHYSLLRTVEENFGLGTLGKNDADSNWLRFLWDEHFAWGEPVGTPLRASGGMSAATLGEQLHAVSQEDGGLVHRVSEGSAWSDAQPLPLAGSAFALTAAPDGTLLLVSDAGAAVLHPDEGWKAAAGIVAFDDVEAVALAPCNRGSDLMLALRRADGSVWSRRFRAGDWEDPVDTGVRARGAVALQALGHCLLLVHDAGAGELAAASMNTAPFNVVTLQASQYAGPYDDTTIDVWSVGTFPVGHFAAAASPVTPAEREPALRPYRTNGPIALAELDGVVHLVWPHGDEVVDAGFSTAGVMTAKLPVSYRASDAVTTSDGYGTLAQAGWSEPLPILGVRERSGGAVALARRGDELILLTQTQRGGPCTMSRGRWSVP